MMPLWLFLAVPTLLPTTQASRVDGASKPAQAEKAQAEKGELVRVDPLAAPSAPRRLKDPSQFDPDAWRAALTQADLGARELAFERLTARITGNGPARAALEEWARDESAPELAWTSRLALRELTRVAALRKTPRAPSIRLFHQPHDEFHAPPTELFVELEHKVEELMREAPPAGAWTPMPGESGPGQVFQLQTGPAGVKLELREVVEGVETRKTFEAENLAKLFEAHPELEGRINIVRVFPQGAKRDIQDLIQRLRGQLVDPGLQGGATRPLPTDILGVYANPLAKATPSDPTALLVERIESDTIAAILDVRRGDLLLELNGRVLATGDDLSHSMSSRKPGEDIRLKIQRGGRESTLIWTPSPEEK